MESKSKWDIDVKVEESIYYWRDNPRLIKNKIINNNKPKVVELFSGCGGTSLGFQMAGFDVILGADIHRPSIESFKKSHPRASTILGDIKRINHSLITEAMQGHDADVLIAGVPCQGFSLNNRKRHSGDERNLLYKEFVRIIKLLKPKVVVLENVSGIKSTGNFVDKIKVIWIKLAK